MTECICIWASLLPLMVRNLPTTWETWVQSLGWEDPLEAGMATHPLQYSCLENLMDRGAWWGRKDSDMTEQLTRSLSRWKLHNVVNQLYFNLKKRSEL